MKGIQHSYTTKSSEVLREQAPPHQRSRKISTIAALMMMCVPVAGLRVPSCRRCPWPPQRLSPDGPFPRRCSGCRSLQVAFPSPPSQRKKTPSQRSVLIWKLTTSRRGSSIRLHAARRRSISILLCRPVELPDSAVPSMQA